MAIKVGQAFERTSAQPIDTTLVLTKAQMKTVNDNLMPDYYFTICQEDGKIYLYDKTATPSAATGKFTEFSGGGGGSAGHIILDNDGTAMAEEPNLQFKGLNVTDNSTDEITEVESAGLNQDSMDDVLNASISGNQVASNGLVYSTEEQVVGKWIDGKPLYQKTFAGTTPSNSDMVGTPIGASIESGFIVSGYLSDNGTIISVNSVNSTITGAFRAFIRNNTSDTPNQLFVQATFASWQGKPYRVTIQYTKTS